MTTIMDSENRTGTNLQEAPSQDGVFSVEGMKGLSRINQSEVDEFNRRMENLHWGRSVTRDAVYRGGAIGNLLPTDFGESKYDTELSPQDLLEGEKNINQLRAEKQSSASKLANGVLGALSLAGTTFVRGTIGLLYGAGSAVNEGRLSALWDNDVNNAMNAWDSFVDEQAPIYLTKYEEDHPWKTVFSAGNLSNNLIKNAGFMIGAALAGQVYSGAIQGLGIANKIGSGVASINASTKISNAAKAGYELGKATMQRQAAGIGSQALVSTMSAIGEGSFEAANNSREYEEAEIQRRQAEFQELMSRPDVQREILSAASASVSMDDYTVIGPEGQRIVDYEGHAAAVGEAYDNLVNQRWSEIRAEIHDKALKMGNADMFMNIPLLAISNWIQFGRLFRGGFKANKAVAGIKGNFKEGFKTAPKKAIRAKRIGAALLSPATEGFEEMNQAAVAEGASIWTSSELDSFIDDRYDPDAERETSGFMSSIWNGLVDTYSNPDNWLEFVYGAMMGAVPMPVAKRKSNGKIGVGYNWEMVNKIRESGEGIAKAEELVNYLNTRIEDPKFQSNWNSLVANASMQAKMNRTLADPFNFKNYEHRQTIHDLLAIEKAGKLDLFKEQLKDWSSQPLTQEFIDEIKDAATGEDGKSWMDGMSNEEIYETYQRNANQLLDTVEFFGQAARNIKSTYGDVFTDDALDEMVYIRTQIQDWQNRAKSIKDTLGPKVAQSLRRLTEGTELSEGQKVLIDWLGSSEDDIALLKEKDFENVSKFLEAAVQASDIVDKDQTLRDLTDLMRINVSITNAIETYNKHIVNPDKLNAKIEKKKAERGKEVKLEEDAEKVASVGQRLDNATTYSDIVDALNSEDLSDLSEQTIEGAQKLEDARNTVLKVDTARRVASTQANKSKDPIDRAASAMIEKVTESMPSDVAINPERALEVYGPALEEAAANAEIAIPEGAEEQFTSDVIERVEEALRNAQEEMRRYESAPDVLSDDQFPDIEDTDLEGALPLEVPQETKLPEPQEAVDAPIRNIPDAEMKELSTSPAVRGSGKTMVYTAVPEIHKEAAKFRDGYNARVFPDSEEWADWERKYDSSRTPTDFSEIYKRLKAFGAFDYVRTHVITPGTEVYYVADTGFRGTDPEKYGIPIFLAIKDPASGELQVIGAAPSYKNTEVPGLKEIGEALEAQAKDISTPGLLVSDRTTRVSVVNDGTFINSNSKISTVDASYIGDAKVSLGVVVNGQIYNKDGAVSRAALSTSIGDFTKYNGRPVLLVRAPSGRYKIMPLRTKRFGVDIAATDLDNPIVREINRAADKIVSSTSEEAAKQAVLDLKASLYLPGVYIRVATDRIGNRSLIFTGKGEDGKYHELLRPVIISENVPIGGTPTITRDSAKNEILGALSSLEAMFQVSPRLLENNAAYEKYYFDSGILYTDIDNPNIYGSWMIFEDSAKSSQETKEEIKKALVSDNEVTLGRKSYRSSPEGWRNSDGSLVVDPRTIASLNRKFTVDGAPKQATPTTSRPAMNTFAVGRVTTPRVRRTKAETISGVNKSQKDLENTNNLLIFAKLDEKQKESLTSKGISEADFNTMSRDQQDKIIECYS